MMNLVYGSSFSSLMAFLCFTVMSEFSLDEPGFKAPGALTPVPLSSDSFVEAPPEVRRKCVACPRRMSKKMADRHTLCVNCRGFDCDLDNRSEECLEWPEEEVRLYAKYRKSLKSKDSSKSKPSAPPPPADSMPSSQPSMRGDIQSQVDSLNVTVNTLAESLSARLDALTASLISSQSTQLSSQPRLRPDVGEPQPGVTAGTRRTFQALGVPNGTPVVPPNVGHPFGQGYRAPASEQLGSASVGSGCRSVPLRRLRVMGLRLLNLPPMVGFLLALLPLVTIVTPVHLPSRRPAMRRAMSPSGTPHHLAWLTSYMRSAQTLVRCLTLRVSRAAALRLGSASHSLQPPSSASGFTPGSRRWSRRLLLGWRLWLAAPNLSPTSSLLVRAVTRLQMILCSPHPMW